MPLITLKRVYEVNPPYTENTYLVDRLWPRGISKEKLAGVIWCKEVAPSNELRKWFHSNLQQWSQFVEQYQQELAGHQHWQPLLEQLKAGQSLTFLYGSKELQRNHAIVLQDFLLAKLG